MRSMPSCWDLLWLDLRGSFFRGLNVFFRFAGSIARRLLVILKSSQFLTFHNFRVYTEATILIEQLG